MPMLLSATALKLAYDFESKPNPILASAPGVAPRRIDLQIVVSNPLRSAVDISKITIEIPVGQEISRDLSNTTSLPSADYDRNGPWTISTANGTVTITPRDGAVGQVTAPIVFSLPGIVVNQTPGAVPLTVSEFPPSAGKIEDTTTYKLHKQPADFPVINFRAEPATVTDLGTSVKLYWTCSEQGKQNVFGLRIANIQSMAMAAEASAEDELTVDADVAVDADVTATATFHTGTPFKNCVADGNCYTWHDGENGVETPTVNQTTTFALDVVQTTAGGGRVVTHTVETVVQVVVPWIAQQSYAHPSFSGQLVRFGWMAFNAASCSVQLGGTELLSGAPTNTYNDGYIVPVRAAPGTYNLTVIATAVTGKAQASWPLPPVQVSALVSIPTGASPRGVAITPDGRLALVANSGSNTVTVVDLTTRTAERTAIAVGSGPNKIAITSDGSLALVTNTGSNDVSVIDIARRTAESTRIPAPGAGDVVIMPGGTQALVTNAFNGDLAVIDIAKRTVETTITGAGAPHVAVTPDGALALGTGPRKPLTVTDLHTRKPEPTTIPLPDSAWDIAIAPDGQRAFIPIAFNSLISIIDIPKRQVQGGIQVASYPTCVAVGRTSTQAFATNQMGLSVSMIDVTTGRSQAVGLGQVPAGITVAPDGVSLLVTLNNGVCIAI